MTFQLPAELPISVDELNELRDQAAAEIATIQERYESDETLTSDDVAELNQLLDSVDQINSALVEATAEAEEHRSLVTEAMNRAKAATAVDSDDDEDEEGDDEDSDEDAIVEAEVVVEKELIAASAKKKTLATKKRPVNFAGTGTVDTPEAQETGPGWVVAHGAPGFDPQEIGTKVGFARIGEALDSVRKGHVAGKNGAGRTDGPRMRQTVASMSRDLPLIEDDHALVAEITRATDQRNLPGGSLIAAGGWTAPSEQLYDFCDVPEATDLISLPEIAIRRGGIRWPVEPDLTSIFESFEWFFTEPELAAVDGSGNPTAIKQTVEIPAPTEFRELRLNAVGYSVTAGILQRQGWPESIEWFLRSLTQEHFRAMSRRTIRDMWNGGNAVKTFDAALAVGGTSGQLNAIALYATNLRLQRGLSRTATIEGVAPAWFHEALRADLAMMEGKDTFAVGDGEIQGWLSARNVAFQFVGDWQTRSLSQPGNLSTLRWPGHVDIMMFPAGTWFRSLSNVIEVGVMYPKDQLQVNRYTEFFTEDAIAIGKRCGQSANLRIPLNVSGGYGAPVTISYADTTADLGGGFDPTPAPSGQQGLPKTTTVTVTGTPTGGTFKLTYLGEETAAIAYNASAATVKSALVALNDALDAGDFTVTGGALPGTAVVVVARGGGAVTVSTKALTGGTSPDVAAS